MKKLYLLLLASVLVLAGCQSSRADSDTAGSTENQSTSGSEGSSGESAKDSAASEQTFTFEEITAVDNDECTVKITGIDPDNMWGYTLNVELENKSADKTYMYSVENASVNGIATDPMFAVTVAPGKKSSDEITFLEDLEEEGAGEFSDIELTFKVYDQDDWTADPAAEETVHVYPLGQDKAKIFVRQAQSSDTVAAQNDSVSVIVTGYYEDGIYGYTVNLYLENNTDQELMFSIDDASINGYMEDPFWACLLQGKKVKFDSISWTDTSLEEDGITSVEEIEFTLNVYNPDDFTADPVLEQTVILRPSKE